MKNIKVLPGLFKIILICIIGAFFLCAFINIHQLNDGFLAVAAYALIGTTIFQVFIPAEISYRLFLIDSDPIHDRSPPALA